MDPAADEALAYVLLSQGIEESLWFQPSCVVIHPRVDTSTELFEGLRRLRSVALAALGCPSDLYDRFLEQDGQPRTFADRFRVSVPHHLLTAEELADLSRSGFLDLSALERRFPGCQGYFTCAWPAWDDRVANVLLHLGCDIPRAGASWFSYYRRSGSDFVRAGSYTTGANN